MPATTTPPPHSAPETATGAAEPDFCPLPEEMIVVPRLELSSYAKRYDLYLQRTAPDREDDAPA